MLSLFFIPLIILSFGVITHVALLFMLYILSGIGMAGIGMGVMHDAIHGSYSKNKRVNKVMGFTMNLIGANSTVWKIQHNVLHHTYTNIEQADDDINTPLFLRFSPHAKHYWLHRFQYIYVWFFYGLSTISWITMKDFVRITRYKNLGLLDKNKVFGKEVVKLVGWKLLYYSYALILPLIMVPLSAWIIILGFITMHFITGLLISVVFQTAHVMPNTDFPLPDKNGLLDKNWTLHQMATTTNYAPGSRLFSWLIGGLNYQVEHHLLPNVCHVHYRQLSKIVKSTAEEYGIPYHTKRTFFDAIVSHIRMLRQLGRVNPIS
ncbi:acyl-CoA desaturase [Fulvivirga ulvae]|uniref:fatty acid desaturase family protein n=1 Tax=Fulvivirga ulvae TaxID=2904245 RepID=UPI001F3FCDE9|nr:acyl-CoA desaturase [Fulvivirga ulvae]UII32793.1 acyl-CoA desaturase [Fulvivirga ulvae]